MSSAFPPHINRPALTSVLTKPIPIVASAATNPAHHFAASLPPSMGQTPSSAAMAAVHAAMAAAAASASTSTTSPATASASTSNAATTNHNLQTAPTQPTLNNTYTIQLHNTQSASAHSTASHPSTTSVSSPQQPTTMMLFSGNHNTNNAPQSSPSFVFHPAAGNIQMNNGNHMNASLPMNMAGIPLNMAGIPLNMANLPLNVNNIPLHMNGVPMNLNMNMGHIPLNFNGLPMNLNNVAMNIPLAQSAQAQFTHPQAQTSTNNSATNANNPAANGSNPANVSFHTLMMPNPVAVPAHAVTAATLASVPRHSVPPLQALPMAHSQGHLSHAAATANNNPNHPHLSHAHLAHSQPHIHIPPHIPPQHAHYFQEQPTLEELKDRRERAKKQKKKEEGNEGIVEGDENELCQTIVECGRLNHVTGQRVYFESYSADGANEYEREAFAFFGDKKQEIYIALNDPQRRTLYRASTLAEKFGYATNKIGMYLARRKSASVGIYQATAFRAKPAGRNGLKSGGYFLTLQACQDFQQHFKIFDVEQLLPPSLADQLESEEDEENEVGHQPETNQTTVARNPTDTVPTKDSSVVPSVDSTSSVPSSSVSDKTSASTQASSVAPKANNKRKFEETVDEKEKDTESEAKSTATSPICPSIAQKPRLLELNLPTNNGATAVLSNGSHVSISTHSAGPPSLHVLPTSPSSIPDSPASSVVASNNWSSQSEVFANPVKSTSNTNNGSQSTDKVNTSSASASTTAAASNVV